MRGRRYNSKIGIYNITEVPDGFGGYIQVPALVRKVWAAKETTGAGYKFQQFGLNEIKSPVIFRVRGKKTLVNFNDDTFVEYKGKRYEIKGIEDVDLNTMEYNLYCEGTGEDMPIQFVLGEGDDLIGV